MNRRSGAGVKLDLNLSPPRVDSPRLATALSPTHSGSPSSCLSLEVNGADLNLLHHGRRRYHQHIWSSNIPKETSMVLVGCARCLMYVMLSEDNPKCPRCKSTVLLSFQQETNEYNDRNSDKKQSSRNRCSVELAVLPPPH
ncbi:hypothetical protein SAY87_008983 [Trapa incisa]|uniref:GIR1-like zinc ribbon domain-containing protein n=2 Tax=Trapa TaxID=22665 RepID=A0AAN7RGS2_TRANT|nr:hypothetical protein SAY87_008983 [Trapa incisa]KAK4797746.1 hypothetical protein SAY86_030072 [Trapa natans]